MTSPTSDVPSGWPWRRWAIPSRRRTAAPQALRLAGQRPFDVALVDLRLGGESGLDLLASLLGQWPRLAVVIITAHASVDSAVEAMRRGAFDYLSKPFTPAQVRAVLERVARVRGLRDRVADLEERVRAEVPEADLEGRDPEVRRVLDLARKVAPPTPRVLIRGESGTGKGVLAHALHAWSRRAGGPFVTVSCPSLSAELLESDLFGHVRGAFTGAVRDAAGKVAAAEGGTLFLDEVGDLPLPLQPKLLRFLQEKRYERVGEATTRAADVRLVAATNRDLESAVASGAFREDLLYRLNVIELTLPPLRLRGDAAATGRPPPGVLRPPARAAADRLHGRGARGDGEAPLAGQPPRASERGGAGGDPGRRAGGRPRRPPRASRPGPRGGRGGAGRGRRPRHARGPGCRTHPPRHRSVSQPR